MRALTCGLFLALALAAGAYDLRRRRIPNWLTVTGAVSALALAALLGGPAPVAQHALGMGVALVIGFACFAFRVLGAGDAKLLAAFGAWFGLAGLPLAFIAMTGGGALLAIGWAMRQRILKSTLASTAGMLGGAFQGHLFKPIMGGTEAGKLPYGVGISLGASAWWIWTGCSFP